MCGKRFSSLVSPIFIICSGPNSITPFCTFLVLLFLGFIIISSSCSPSSPFCCCSLCSCSPRSLGSSIGIFSCSSTKTIVSFWSFFGFFTFSFSFSFSGAFESISTFGSSAIFFITFDNLFCFIFSKISCALFPSSLSTVIIVCFSDFPIFSICSSEARGANITLTPSFGRTSGLCFNLSFKASKLLITYISSIYKFLLFYVLKVFEFIFIKFY